MSISVTQKQLEIMVIIFTFRGVLFEQLTKELARRMDRPLTKTFKQNTYKDVQALDKSKLIARGKVTLDQREKHFIYLTEKGFELASLRLDITPGYWGQGFNGDHGDFTYDPLHKPGKSNVEHQILLTDVFMSLGLLANHYPVTHRDNRYCSVPYVWEGKEHRFRPDGEILIDGKLYLIEADRGTEDGDDLRAKFEGYDRYFKWLKQNERAIPAGVIAVYHPPKVTGIGFNRRWSTFLNAFMAKMSAWYLDFNMSFVLLDDLEKVLIREMYPDHHRDTALQIIKSYVNPEHGVGATLRWNDDVKGDFNKRTVFSITKRDDGSQKVHVIERFEHAESRPIARIFAMYRFMIQKPEYRAAASFIPILCYCFGEVVPTFFNGFDKAAELNALFGSALWLRVKDGMPYWSDSKGNHHKVSNPLL